MRLWSASRRLTASNNVLYPVLFPRELGRVIATVFRRVLLTSAPKVCRHKYLDSPILTGYQVNAAGAGRAGNITGVMSTGDEARVLQSVPG